MTVLELKNELEKHWDGEDILISFSSEEEDHIFKIDRIERNHKGIIFRTDNVVQSLTKKIDHIDVIYEDFTSDTYY